MDLKDKVVIITGSSKGIGKACAEVFAKKGCKIVLNYINDQEAAADTHAEILNLGAKAILVKANTAIPEGIDNLFKEAIKEFKQVDILINNVAYVNESHFFEAAYDEWETAFNTNILSLMYASRRACELMKANGGVILNNASAYGIEHLGNPTMPAYSASKAAVINFTKTLAKIVKNNIRVNAVAPGFTKTPAWDGVEEEYIQTRLDKTVIKRWITADEVAKTFVFLAENDAITGEVITVDGGFSLKIF